MLWFVSVFVVAVWGWGVVTQSAGWMIHLLLVAAAAIALIAVLTSGRRPWYVN
jgi:Family of unknown function (DUF5670)